MLWIKALLVWSGIAVLAVTNGVARNALIRPRVGEQAAHVASTVILCGVISIVAWLTNPWIAPETVRGGFAIGVFWLSLTIAFEFLAGHYLFGHPWEWLFADYNLAHGRVWILVLVATLVGPGWAEWVRSGS